MRTLSVREMREAIGHLDKLVEEEGELLIVRHGKPIARVFPVQSSKKAMPSHADLRKSMPRIDMGSEILLRLDREER